MKGLNIHLKSFDLKQNLVNSQDKILVSATTFPEKNNDAFVTGAKHMNSVNYDFKVNIADKTDGILIVFRKIKSENQTQVIASALISSKMIPINNSTNNETKVLKICEPTPKSNKDQRVLGEMQIQLTLTKPFPDDSKDNSQHKRKAHHHLYSELKEKNEEIPYSLFLYDD